MCSQNYVYKLFLIDLTGPYPSENEASKNDLFLSYYIWRGYFKYNITTEVFSLFANRGEAFDLFYETH